MNTIGFGKIVKSVEATRDNRPAWRCISDTGVMIITDEAKTSIITMWIASVSQLKKIYCDEVIPQKLYDKVVFNTIYQEDQKRL